MTAAARSSPPFLPLFGESLEALRQHCLQCYVVPLCYAALSHEPAARSVYFAIARLHDAPEGPDEHSRPYLSHRFILSTDERPRWPHALCASSNPLLDGRSDRAVTAAHEELYGAPAVDIGSRGRALLAWSAFCKPDRRTRDLPAQSFTPVLSMARRERVDNEYVSGPFAADITVCATLWQPELEHGTLVSNTSAPERALPSGFGADELARLTAAHRTLPTTLPWSEAYARDFERILTVCEALAQGPLDANSRAYLRGPGIDALLRGAASLLEQS